MALDRRIDDGGVRYSHTADHAPIGDLLKRLGRDGAELVRQEVNLAKLEMKENTTAIAMDAVKIAVWLGVAIVGGLALTAFLILVIGILLGGAYWAGALIVGVVFTLLGALMARRAAKDMQKHDIKPDETIQTLKQDKQWIQREARDMKRDLAA